MRIASIASVLIASVPALAADSPSRPVIVYSQGPERMRVRIATGYVLPCESSSNTMLFDGFMDPGQRFVLVPPGLPLCVQHTYGDFPDADWSTGRFWPTGCKRCPRSDWLIVSSRTN